MSEQQQIPEQNPDQSSEPNESTEQSAIGAMSVDKVDIDQTEWLSGISEDLRESVANFNSADDLVKAYGSLQSKLGENGENRLFVPGEEAAPEDWEKVWNKLGRPEAVDGYKIPDPPEGFDIDEDFTNDFTAVAHENGLNQKQMEGILNWYNGKVQEAFANTENEVTEGAQEVTNTLRQEWGPNFDQMNKAVAATMSFAPEDLAKQLESTALGNNIGLLKMFANIGQHFLEAGMEVDEGGKQSFGMSPQEAKAALDAMRADFKHPYHDKTHPNHQAAVQESNRLAELAFS